MSVGCGSSSRACGAARGPARAGGPDVGTAGHGAAGEGGAAPDASVERGPDVGANSDAAREAPDAAPMCRGLFVACQSDEECCAPNRCLDITGTPECQQEGPQQPDGAVVRAQGNELTLTFLFGSNGRVFHYRAR
jgi:hypothetical protein